MKFNKKNVTIFGLGKSGVDLSLLLDSFGANVRVTDAQDTPAVRENAKKLPSKAAVEIGAHSNAFIEGSDIIVVSPGVKSDLPILVDLSSKGIPVIGEIEAAASLCPAEIVAITGTNGKSTVTTLVSEVLKLTGRNVFLCGNIGIPFSSCISQVKKDDIVCLEVSSFQLETTVHFKPKVAVFLNFSRNHLNRHKDMTEYFQAKKKIFANQDESDWAVLNYRDTEIRNLAKEIKAEVVYFNEPAQPDEFVNPNYRAVAAIASIFKVDGENCNKVFRAFKGLEHRLEFVRTIRDIDFINDSKSTTVDAGVWALQNATKPIIMIAGGRDKGGDFSLIKDEASKKVKELIVIGEAREKIKSTLLEFLNIKESDTFADAVHLAFKDARAGDCVMLSPMCASFDMFSNFEERGTTFKHIVGELL
ncbi:UDP-N-acetylmuramoyl-L-alanine--D-glutamate ligase [Candidatus Omnitrophota bacterium]